MTTVYGNPCPWCDAVVFVEAVGQGRYDEALDLYSGELLPAFYIEDAPGFEEWLENERQRLRELAVRAAGAQASTWQQGGHLTLALSAARRALELSDVDERAARQLLELLDQAGDRAGAVREYESLARRMIEQYGVEPAPETKALIDRIRSRAEIADTNVGRAFPIANSHAVGSAGGRGDTAASQLGGSESPDAPASDGRRPSRRWRLTASRLSVVAAIVLALMGLAAMRAWPSLASLWAGDAGDSRSDRPTWVLLADFDSPSDDPMLGAAIRELVSTVLDESKVLSTIPLDQLTDARRAAQVPDSARLTFELARHLAYRTAVRSVVEGRVDRLAKDSYSIVVRARDVEDERVLIAVNGTASSKTIIPTVERLARDVGTTLLAHRGPGLAPPSLDQPITASFDAYRRYVAALQRMDENGDYDGAVELLREAVALDSNFAAAWWQLGDAAIQTPQAWRVGDAYDRARRLSDRLTITQRLALEASVARADGEPPRALDNWDQLVAARPTSAAAFFGRARILRQLGRYDEAVESFRKALQLTPLGPRQIILSDLAITLAPMGRIDEARSLTVQLSGVLKREAETLLALVEENWQRADSLFAEAAADPTLNAADRSESAAALAACEAARGHVAAANQNLLRADEYVGLHESLTVDIAARLQLLALAAGGKAPTAKKVALSQGHTRAGIGSDTALNGHLMRGLVGVWSGDTASSRRELRALLTGPGAERGMVPNVVAILDGWMSSREERWPDVVRALAPIARGNEQQPSFIFALTASRWLVADAYERLGQPDSAAAFFERLVRSPHFHDQRSRGLVSSFAHRRLARLYDRMGKHDMARRHWQTFLSTFTEPDPELRPLVEEARVALSRAFEDSKALESASSLGASWFELIRSKESPVSR